MAEFVLAVIRSDKAIPAHYVKTKFVKILVLVAYIDKSNKYFGYLNNSEIFKVSLSGDKIQNYIMTTIIKYFVDIEH